MPYFSVLGILKYDDSLVGQLNSDLVTELTITGKLQSLNQDIIEV